MCAVKLVSVTLFEANSELVSASLGIEVRTKYNKYKTKIGGYQAEDTSANCCGHVVKFYKMRATSGVDSGEGRA